MGTGYKNSARHYNSIGDNLSKVANDYHYSNGYFGYSAKGKDNRVRHIVCNNPLATSKDLYNKLTYGGIEKVMPNGKGVFTKMKDGTIISYREYLSSDGTPVVDVNIRKSIDTSGIKQQKIHFVKKGRYYE